MKKHGYLSYLFSCLYLLICSPLSANADTYDIPAVSKAVNNYKESARPIKITPHTSQLTLVFKKNSIISNLYLIAPDGIKHSIAKLNDGILATSHYEVMQIKYPFPGEWVLSGPEEQIKQILVLTDISLDTNFKTGIYFNDELLSLSGYIEQKKTALTSDMAVEGMTMKLELKNKSDKFSYVIPYEKNGLFNNNLILHVPSGTYKVTWSTHSNFLSLERQYMMIVQNSPFEQDINTDHDALMIKLLSPDLINPSSVKIKILYKNAPQNVPIIQNGLAWIINLESLCKQASFSEDDLLITILGQTTSKRDLVFKLLLNGKVCSPNYIPMKG